MAHTLLSPASLRNCKFILFVKAYLFLEGQRQEPQTVDVPWGWGSDWRSRVEVGMLKGSRQFREGRQLCGQHHQPVWLLDCGQREMGPWKDSLWVFPGVRGQGHGVERQIESQPERSQGQRFLQPSTPLWHRGQMTV